MHVALAAWALLLRVVFLETADGEVKDNLHLPFFVDGQRALLRHPVNDRMQTTVLESYVASISEKGLVAGVRGAAWATEVDPGQGVAGKYLMLTFGTLSSAAYLAHDRVPNNPFVVSTIEGGITGATLFSARTPTDVLRFLKDYHNSFHSGSKYSFPELLEDARVHA